jgi:adenylate cyclase
MTTLTMKKYRFYLYFLLFFLQNTTSFLWANPKADSLLQVLARTTDERLQYELHCQVARTMLFESIRTSIEQYNLAQAIAAKNNWTKEEGGAYLGLSQCYQIQVDTTANLHSLELAKPLFLQANDYNNYCTILALLANYHLSMERTTLARNLVNEGLSFADQKKTTIGKGIMLAMLGRIYINQDSLDRCLVVNEQAIELLKNSDQLGYLGNAHNNTGIVYYYKTKLFQALSYYEKAQQYYFENGDQIRVGITTLNIAQIYEAIHEYSTAEKQYLLLLKQSEEGAYARGVFLSKVQLASLYMNMGQNETAYQWFLPIQKDSEKFYKGEDYVLFLSNYLQSAIRSKHLNEAKTIYTQLETKLKQYDSKLMLNIGLLAQGEYWFSVGEYNKSYSLLKKSITASLHQEDKQTLKEGYGFLTKICFLLKKEQEGKEAFEAYQKLEYSLISEDNLSRLQFYKNKQEQDAQNIEHEKEIATLQLKAATDQKQKRMWTWFGVITLLGVGAYIVNLYGRYREKTESNLLLNKANERNEALLLNILPSEVANELKSNGKTEAKEIASATVLFSDIQNFTQLSERMNATDLVAELDYCFSAFDAIVARYPVEKIKTVGDAYICAGGLPNANTTHPLDIVRVAIDFQVFMQQYKQQRALEKRPFFEMRIGIHTGSLVAGVVGTTKFVYDIWGDTVNTAARLEQNGEVGKINLSEETYQHIQSTYACTYRGKYEVKHKGAIAMYFLEF